ncbi:hypothetical protein GIY30_08165 [Gordonia sp. HNM0687]|uniref:Uncharacterized protein n=1 Tax=Gordonia mangrovi TaxID=2665643 RepID=A0A6L7GN82_9ACTN|nr:hypothetical protein [Gordonia mangrovi]
MDWAADQVSGPRRRSAVARRLSTVLSRHTIRAIPSGWTVSSPTGSATVCRTFDQLVDVVTATSGLTRDEAVALGLAH